MKRILKNLFLVALVAAWVSAVNLPHVAAQNADDKKKDAKEKIDKKNGEVDWQKLLAETRSRFAGSQDSVLQQTRIDRAYFDLNPDDPDQPPYLKFTGVCLHTVHDDDKQMKEILTKELSQFKVPNTKFVLKIDEIQFHDTPIYKLQSDAIALRKMDAEPNVFFERATYGQDGGLQLHLLYLQPETPAQATMIAKLFDKSRLPAELTKLPTGKGAKTPGVVRRDYDWLAARATLRRQFASDSDLLLTRTRLDDAYLDYTADKKNVQFHVDGVCVHPPGLVDEAKRAELWKNRIAPWMPTITTAKTKVAPMVAGVVLLPNPCIAWQNDLAQDERQDGVFFQLAQFDMFGKLKWIVKSASQKHQAAADKAIANRPLAAKLGPVADKSPEYQYWNWYEVLPKGQARLAEGDFLLHRARLDRVFLKYDDPKTGIPYLNLAGVSLHPVEVEPAVNQRLKLESALTDLLPTALEHKWNTERMRYLVSPIYALQMEVNSRNIDGLLFADGRYDKDGKLQLIIAVASDAQKDTASDIVKSTLMAEGVIGPRDDKNTPRLHFTVLPWDEIFDQMQHWLARDTDTLLRKTRVDRGFFSYPDSKIGPELNLAAVGIYPKKDAYTARLKKRFESFIRLYFADQLHAGPVAAVPLVQHVENPAPSVQLKVAETPMLDGIRLDDASFTGAGKLVFHGIWIGSDQEFWLEKLVHETLTADYPPLKHGIHWGSMQDFDSPALLLRLRTWIANQEEIDEVWLERFYFDASGKTRVSGFSTRPQDKEKAVRKLPDFLPTFESKKLPSLDPNEKAPPKVPEKKAEKDVVPVVFAQEPKDDGPIQLESLPNVAQYLRDNIPKVLKCDGLRIDRCFYDPQGIFRIDGLADHAEQFKELKQFLNANKVPFDRTKQLAQGWDEGRQIVIALRPMMTSLNENLPSVREFDGLTLKRAHHDPKNRLVFSGNAIGTHDAKELAETLKRLLATHSRWRLRTIAGVVVDITDSQKPNRDLARKNVMRALHLLQVNIGEAYVEPIGTHVDGWWSHAWPFDPKLPRMRPTDDDYDRCLQWLDAALLHNPKDVLAWYLRGYVLQTKSRSDLSLRDYRRMVAIEIDDTEVRHHRILALELVQGVLRQSAFRIEQKAILQFSEGWILRELRDPPSK